MRSDFIDRRWRRLIVIGPLVIQMTKEMVVGALTWMVLGVEAIAPTLSVVLDWIEFFHWKLYNGGQEEKRGGITIKDE